MRVTLNSFRKIIENKVPQVYHLGCLFSLNFLLLSKNQMLFCANLVLCTQPACFLFHKNFVGCVAFQHQ